MGATGVTGFNLHSSFAAIVGAAIVLVLDPNQRRRRRNRSRCLRDSTRAAVVAMLKSPKPDLFRKDGGDLLTTQSVAVGSPEHDLTAKQSHRTLLKENEPRQQERKLGARLVRAREPARLSQPAATPNRAVGANDSTHPDSSLRIIHLFGAAGVLVPLIIMPL